MKKDFVLAIFDCEEKLLLSTEKTVGKNIEIYDIYTPFAVHGLDDAMGIKRSFLPYITMVAGSCGLLFAMWFQIWTHAIDWPTIIGGKPFVSIPAFIPIAFEITILAAAHITVATFLFSNKLFPGKKPLLMDPHQTDYHFVMAIEKGKAGVNVDDVSSMFKEHGAIEVRVQNIELNP